MARCKIPQQSGHRPAFWMMRSGVVTVGGEGRDGAELRGREGSLAHQGGALSQVPEYRNLTEEIGKWGGDIAKAQLPDYFEVEYVRVDEINQSGRGLTSGESR